MSRTLCGRMEGIMRENRQLTKAKSAKNDEFYTQYADIQKEINAYLDYDPNVFRGKTVLLPCDDPEWSNFTRFFAQNFETLGLKKLISTSYAPDAKKEKYGILFEYAAEQNGGRPQNERGKIFVLDHDTNASGRIDLDDLEWDYLDGDGDFRSEEVCKLRDEADVIVTNPPFSLFREFLAWILAAKNAKDAKQFLVIGNMNAITYKEVFPLIMQNRLWLGNGFNAGNAFFGLPPNADSVDYAKGVFDAETGLVKFRNCCWLTNLEHGRRHQPMQLMTERENVKFSKHKEVRGVGYRHYDNYDAIEVPFTDAIPGDYDGVMGVPISFLDKYCPEQFELLGITDRGNEYGIKIREYTEEDTPKFGDLNRRGAILVNGELQSTYARILIRARRT